MVRDDFSSVTPLTASKVEWTVPFKLRDEELKRTAVVRSFKPRGVLTSSWAMVPSMHVLLPTEGFSLSPDPRLFERRVKVGRV